MVKKFMTGNEAIAEAAIQAGCRHFFGYPITPQNEIPEYMSKRMPEVGGVYLQAESEVAAINMLFGAAGAGARVMTSSSSPGISLMQEGISYIVGAQLPCVIVNIMRGGPGLGGIQPSQSDYFQATKGGGHGDYHLLVLAPHTIQEAVSLTMDAFNLADKYRNPVLVLGDGYMGQMMEPVEFKKTLPPKLPSKDWALTGAKGRPANLIKSLLKVLREKDIKAGMIRPITVFPFQYETLNKVAETVNKFLVVEMSLGQMVEDVKLGVCGKAEVRFYGRTGGMVPNYDEIVTETSKLVKEAS